MIAPKLALTALLPLTTCDLRQHGSSRTGLHQFQAALQSLLRHPNPLQNAEVHKERSKL